MVPMRDSNRQMMAACNDRYSSLPAGRMATTKLPQVFKLTLPSSTIAPDFHRGQWR